MAEPTTVTEMEHCRVSPPPGFIHQTSLPLTFFDIMFLPISPFRRVFFYTYHHSSTHFINITLPNIKHSLSLTLQHFYPLAGTLTWPLQDTKPYIYCTVDDSVTLMVTESDQDFNNLVGNHGSRDVNEFYPLVPKLPSHTITQVQFQVPVMALQVTLFPNAGICIGITFLHVVADGKSINHFMKSWALVCKSGLGDTSCLVPESLPFCDRSVIHDPYHLETNYLKELEKLDVSPKTLCFDKAIIPTDDLVRATFSIGRTELQKLKSFVTERFYYMYNKDNMTPPTFHLSKLVLICAFVWVCLIKAQASGENDDDMSPEILMIPVDCRERLDPPIHKTYFGNCLMSCFVEVKKNELVGKEGIATAAAAIGNALERIKEDVLRDGDQLFTKSKLVDKKRDITRVAGSPKLGVYGTDFGFGTIKKSEVISSHEAGAICPHESPDEEGAIEIGMVLNNLQMDAFSSFFSDTLSGLTR